MSKLNTIMTTARALKTLATRITITDCQYYVKDTAVSPTMDRNGYSRLN